MKAKFLKDFSLIFSFCRFGGISRDFMKLSLDTFIWVQVRVSYPILANWTNFSATVCNSKRSFNLQINKIAALQLFWLKSVNFFISKYLFHPSLEALIVNKLQNYNSYHHFIHIAYTYLPTMDISAFFWSTNYLICV